MRNYQEPILFSGGLDGFLYEEQKKYNERVTYIIANFSSECD